MCIGSLVNGFPDGSFSPNANVRVSNAGLGRAFVQMSFSFKLDPGS